MPPFYTLTGQSPIGGIMFSEEDKASLVKSAETIENGLCKIADSFPCIEDNSLAIIQAGESIERGLHSVAAAIDRFTEAFIEK